jgi:hypothetical protein
MKESRLTMPEVAALAATRVALGGGLGLLLADRIKVKQRRVVGWALFLLGAVTTVPLAKRVLERRG